MLEVRRLDERESPQDPRRLFDAVHALRNQNLF
jgi:hypothetical protein